MNIFKFFKRKKKSPMLLWAEREINLAIAREHEADRQEAESRGEKYDPKAFSYGGEIYKSALKAFKSLLEDGHSGCSWGFTTNVLTRLMNNRPLSPLTGTDDEWAESGIKNDDGQRDFQNIRCSAVFKTIMPDGTVKYHDSDRIICIDEETNDRHHFGLSSREVDERFPITFPYIPSSKPYEVYDRTFDHVNAEPGCFDTIGVISIKTPEGEIIPVQKYYKETDGGIVQISEAEYYQRLHKYQKKLVENLKKKKPSKELTEKKSKKKK